MADHLHGAGQQARQGGLGRVNNRVAAIDAEAA